MTFITSVGKLHHHCKQTRAQSRSLVQAHHHFESLRHSYCFCFCPLLHPSMCEAYCRWGGGRLGGVHDRLHIYPLCGIFYFPWHRHQIEGTNGFYCPIRKTERFTISNVESQVFTPNNSRLDPGSNPGCPRDKRMSYHWTNCASHTAHLTAVVLSSYISCTILTYFSATHGVLMQYHTSSLDTFP